MAHICTCVYIYCTHMYVCLYLLHTHVSVCIFCLRVFAKADVHFSHFGYWQQEISPCLPQMPPSPEFTGSVRIDTVFNCDHIFPDLFLYLLSFNMSSVNSCPHIHKRSWRFSPRPFQCGKTASVFERAWTGFFHWGEVCIVVIKMGGSTRKKQTNKQKPSVGSVL